MATSESRVTPSKIFINQWRNRASSHDQPGHQLAFTKNGDEPGGLGHVCNNVGSGADNVGRTHAPESMIVGSYANGIKLASELLLDHLLTQFVPGFDHKREALGSPFLDARLHSMRSDGVDD
jgi:hypothetical protein